MKRLAILLIALTTTFASTGCCGLLWPFGHHGQGGYYGNSGCFGGNCGVRTTPGVQVVPQSGFYQSYGSIQAASFGAPGPVGTVSAAPGTVHRTAMVPLETLPTY
ncbi:MAG: hypothetical protein IID45_01215 [Planctomycetes bacterium]|nr:hypothetical protein [Planctomycetota bacterium]